MNTCTHRSIHSTSVSQSFVPDAHDISIKKELTTLHAFISGNHTHKTINHNSHMNEGKCAKCIHNKTLWNCYSHTYNVYVHTMPVPWTWVPTIQRQQPVRQRNPKGLFASEEGSSEKSSSDISATALLDIASTISMPPATWHQANRGIAHVNCPINLILLCLYCVHLKFAAPNLLYRRHAEIIHTHSLHIWSALLRCATPYFLPTAIMSRAIITVSRK